MARIKKIKKFRYFATSPLVWLVLLGIIFGGGRGVWALYQKNQAAARDRAAAAAKLERLRAREAELAAAVESLDTDRGREAALRQTLPVAKPGERVIHILNSNGADNGQINYLPATSDPKTETSWWRLWLAELFQWEKTRD